MTRHLEHPAQPEEQLAEGRDCAAAPRLLLELGRLLCFVFHIESSGAFI
jgi:hypothetical protein